MRLEIEAWSVEIVQLSAGNRKTPVISTLQSPISYLFKATGCPLTNHGKAGTIVDRYAARLQKNRVIASQSADWRGNPVELAEASVGAGRKIDGIATGLTALAMTYFYFTYYQ